MSAEGVLLVALSLASTFAAGAAADLRQRAGWPGGRALAIVLVANLLALPLIAWLAAGALGLGAAATAGLVVAAAAPGGSTGPLLAVVAGGDAALAALLFLLLSALGTIAALLATLAFDVGGTAAVARAALVVGVASMTPLAIGLLLRARRPALAQRLAPWASRVSLVLLIATIGLLTARHGHRATAPDLAVGAILVAVSLLVGLGVAGRERALAVAQVSAVRNLTLALVVIAAVGAPPAATAAVLAYGLVMYLGTGAVAALSRLTAARAAPMKQPW